MERSTIMTLRENAMAIDNREQPDFYGGLMDAIELIPDPVLVGDMCPQDDGGPQKKRQKM